MINRLQEKNQSCIPDKPPADTQTWKENLNMPTISHELEVLDLRVTKTS